MRKISIILVAIVLVFVNIITVTTSTKSASSTELFEIAKSFAWGGETPNATYYFTADIINDCTGCCPIETYTGHDGTWVSYSGSASVGSTIIVGGIPVTIELNASGEKGYWTGSTYSGTSDGSGKTHNCTTFSATSSCKAGTWCQSRSVYI